MEDTKTGRRGFFGWIVSGIAAVISGRNSQASFTISDMQAVLDGVTTAREREHRRIRELSESDRQLLLNSYCLTRNQIRAAFDLPPI